MKEYIFKTNINCGACLNAVTPFLNEERRIIQWVVDVTVPDKLLTVKTEELNAGDIIEVVSNAGYRAELITTVNS
jgi:copper chaperone CopZ